MNILLVTDSYYPEIRSSAHLMQELAEELNKREHAVTVVTCYPCHNLAENAERTVFKELAAENGVRVIRVKAPPVHNIAFVLRGISQLLIPYRFINAIKKLPDTKIDIVIVYSPPLTLAGVGKFVKEKFKAKFILNIQDIFPQNAIDLGIIKNRLLIKIFEAIESKAYNNADKIAVHSKGNKRFLIDKKHLKEEIVKVLHNWIDTLPYISAKRTAFYREKFGIKDKFVFIFAGVIGPSQGLEFLIEIASLIKDNRDICFLLVGDGTQKNRLMKLVSRRMLSNVIFKPFVAKSEYPALVKDADVGLVCLSNMNKTPVVPGKILGYMAASLPIAAFLNSESDGHGLIKDAKCGYSVVSEDPAEGAEIVLSMYKNRNSSELGENGLNYLMKNFTKDICIDRLEEIF